MKSNQNYFLQVLFSNELRLNYNILQFSFLCRSCIRTGLEAMECGNGLCCRECRKQSESILKSQKNVKYCMKILAGPHNLDFIHLFI